MEGDAAPMGAMQQYESMLMSIWVETVELGERFKSACVSGNYDGDIAIPYIAKMLTLHEEMRPMVRGEKFPDAGFEARYMSYSRYTRHPERMLEEVEKLDGEDALAIFGLHEALREAIQQVVISKWRG